MRRRLVPTIAAMLLAMSASAQVKASLSSSNMIYTIGFPGESARIGTLSGVVGAINPGGRVSADFGFDVVEKNLIGLTLAWRPAGWFNVTAGIQKMPFLFENTFSPRSFEMVGYSQATSVLAGYSMDITGINSRSRDCGISVSGSIANGHVDYVAGIFNGNGYSFRDNNRAKDFAGRVMLHVTPALALSAGTMQGRYSLEDGSLADRDRYTAGIWYNDGSIFFRAEDMYGKTADTFSNGIFAMGGIWLRGKYAFAARVDSFIRDVDVRETMRTDAALSFSHLLYRQDIGYRVQFTHSFLPAGRDSDSLTLCFICRFGTIISLKSKSLAE